MCNVTVEDDTGPKNNGSIPMLDDSGQKLKGPGSKKEDSGLKQKGSHPKQEDFGSHPDDLSIEKRKKGMLFKEEATQELKDSERIL